MILLLCHSPIAKLRLAALQISLNIVLYSLKLSVQKVLPKRQEFTNLLLSRHN
jgi:hypothetical protein